MTMLSIALRIAPSSRPRLGKVIDELITRGFVLEEYKSNIGVLIGSCPENIIQSLQKVDGIEEAQIDEKRFHACL